MKKVWSWICLGLFCLSLTGCASTQNASATDSAPSGESTAHTVPSVPVTEVELRNPGIVRIGYTGDQHSVRYITSASQLPDHEAFRAYDDAFFQENALLLITETVGSGSIQLSIDSVTVDGTTATVKLNRHMPGDYGTADMAAWYLWAEVDGGLSLDWVLADTGKTASLPTYDK